MPFYFIIIARSSFFSSPLLVCSSPQTFYQFFGAATQRNARSMNRKTRSRAVAVRAFFTACNSSAGECVSVYACVCMSVRIKLNTTCNFIYSKLNGGKHTQGGGEDCRDRGKCRNAFSFSFSFECEIIFSFFCF